MNKIPFKVTSEREKLDRGRGTKKLNYKFLNVFSLEVIIPIAQFTLTQKQNTI